MRKLLFLILYTFIIVGPALAQQTSGIAADPKKRIVYFKDKAESPYSVQQPLVYLSQKAVDRRTRQHIAITPRDFPVNPAYVASLKQLEGVTLWYTSRWFNAAVVQCTDDKMAEIQALDFVKSSGSLNRIVTRSPLTPESPVAPEQLQQHSVSDEPLTEQSYGPSYIQANMIGAVEMHNKGFSGQGMTIAVLDAGFPAVNTIPAFSHLFQNNRIKGTFDFVKKQVNVYAENGHGTTVLSTMAAYLPGQIIGIAFNANYILLRTEDVSSEHRIEEINWLLGAEYADSAGADVLNSSLGYTTFDAPSPSYTYSDMDGNTALVTKAADYAAATGMLVVTSAGNSGNSASWPYIAAPADADSVLTVGSVNRSGIRAGSSSIGPTADGRLKPDVMAVGEGASVLNTAGNVTSGFGTSFSGPIIAGFAASLWQANPTSTSQEIIQMIRHSGTLSDEPNFQMGYGIPNFNRIPVYVAAPTTTGASHCGPGAVTLAATGAPAGGSYRWYTTAEGGTAIANATGASYTTDLLPTSADFYVAAVTAAGDESERTAAVATIAAVPDAPTVIAAFTYCQGATAAALSANGSNLKWYAAAEGGTALATAPTPLTATVGTTDYFVSQTMNGCESLRAGITVTVNEMPTVTLAPFTNTICSTDASFALTGGQPVGGTYSGTAVSNGSFNAAAAGNGTHTITYSYTGNGCTATAAQDITVSTCTAIAESKLTAGLTLYPNPTNGMLQMAMPLKKRTNLEVRLVDLKGSVVLHKSFPQVAGDFSHSLDLKDKAQGVYMLQLTTDEEVITKRVLRE